uniref:Secreted protein n=1 Tax=Amblyomma triste TaxID=251400 RepID=A0A023G1S8_AMBTT
MIHRRPQWLLVPLSFAYVCVRVQCLVHVCACTRHASLSQNSNVLVTASFIYNSNLYSYYVAFIIEFSAAGVFPHIVPSYRFLFLCVAVECSIFCPLALFLFS